jgi:ATP-dependent exoDNAse (exonuclease V) alpha subunit
MDYRNSSGWPLAPTSTHLHHNIPQHQADADLLERIQLETDAATLAHFEPAAPPKRLRLTPSQQAIHDQILLDVADPSVRSVGLFGNAGVGKTVTTGAIVRSLQLEYGSGVTLCATTHKAARQVEKAMASLGIPDPACITIHRLLGIRQVRDHNTGEEYFTADKNNPPILDETIRVVILDEASMLPQQLYHLLLDATGLFQTLVFVGDDRQLPPVSDGKLCPAFTEAAR